MRQLRERARTLSPLVQLSLVCVLVGLLTAAVVSIWIEARLTELMLAQVLARAQDQVQLGIMSNVRSTDFEPPYTATKAAELVARLDPLLARARQADSDIIRLNLFARDGTILYSDMAGLRGQAISPVANKLLAHALSGTPGVEISDLDDVENADLRAGYGHALEAYIPFILDGQVLGAYEFYEDLDPIEPIRPLVWSSVGAGSAVLCAALLLALAKTLPARPSLLLRPYQPRLAAGGGPSPHAGGGPSPHAGGRPGLHVGGGHNGHPAQPAVLTRRELEVLRLMADGLTYAQIADRLVVDEETVRSHAKGVLRKLGQSSRADAVATARKVGLL